MADDFIKETELEYYKTRYQKLKQYILNSPAMINADIPVDIASTLNVCRICKRDCSGPQQMILNYGEEFSHLDCMTTVKLS